MKFLISVDAVAASDELVIDGKTVEADRQLRLIFDPIVKLWNPYNISLKFDAFTMRVSHLPIGFRWQVQYRATDGTDVVRDYSNTAEDGFVPFRRLLSKYYGGGYGNYDHWLDSMVFSIGDSNGITLAPGEVKVFSSGNATPVPLQQNIDLQEGYNDQGGYLLEQMHLTSDTTTDGSTLDALILANGESRFEVDLSSEDASGAGGTSPSGWAHLRVSTYLFEPGHYADRHNVKNTGADYFYNTSYLYTLTRNIPFEENDGSSMGTARVSFPSSGTALVPDLPSMASSNRQYLLAIELRLKTEDETEDPVPLALFSPTAYVHEARGNSLNRTDFRSGPSYTAHYRRINSAMDTGVQLNGSNQGYYGASHWGGATHVPFLDIPQAPLYSLGQLQNTDTSIHAVDPLLSVGNSFRSPMLNPDVLSGAVTSEGFRRSWTDRSYLLNRSLWDSSFFSTLTPVESPLFTANVIARNISQVLNDFAEGDSPLMNPNFLPYRPMAGEAADVLLSGSDIRSVAPERSAAFLLQDGQFNVNSSSVEAWKSLLGSTLGQGMQYREPTAGGLQEDTGEGAALSRYSLPWGAPNTNDTWKGYRRLDEADVDRLATEVVSLIRERGPSFSLNDFVNREVGSTRGGILEQAIENAGLNDEFTEDVSVGDLSFLPNANARAAVAGKLGQGASQLLLPGDILSVIGQRLATRSDTFRIRAYGEVRNPLSNSNEPVSSAWVEAIVQRVPEYVDRTLNAPWDSPDDDNARLGRKFIIRSLRFLSHDEV